MRYWLTALLAIFIVLLGGCQMDQEKSTKPAEMSVEDLPDVRAFQDDFTREFLQSTEETKEGYYPFLSGTGAYKMDFPAGGIVGEKGYSKKQKEFESYLVGIDEGNGFESSIKIDYYSKIGQTSTELEMLSSQFNQKLDFESYDENNITISLAEFEDDEKTIGAVGLLEHKSTQKGLSIIYESECIRSVEDCKTEKKEMQNKIKQWVNSIKFVKNDESDVEQ